MDQQTAVAEEPDVAALFALAEGTGIKLGQNFDHTRTGPAFIGDGRLDRHGGVLLFQVMDVQRRGSARLAIRWFSV